MSAKGVDGKLKKRAGITRYTQVKDTILPQRQNRSILRHAYVRLCLLSVMIDLVKCYFDRLYGYGHDYSGRNYACQGEQYGDQPSDSRVRRNIAIAHRHRCYEGKIESLTDRQILDKRKNEALHENQSKQSTPKWGGQHQDAFERQQE